MPPPTFLDCSSNLVAEHYQTLTELRDFLSPPAAPCTVGSNKESKASNQNHLIQSSRSEVNTIFFHFGCILKHSAQREKFPIWRISHPHIHHSSYNQSQGDPTFSALGHFSKPFFGISFCRQVLRESKHKTRALQKSLVLSQPLPTLASSPKMRCGPNRWDALAPLTWRSVFWKILFGKFYL